MSRDRKSTRLNSSHMSISYAVFCLKKKKHQNEPQHWNMTTQEAKKTTDPSQRPCCCLAVSIWAFQASPERFQAFFLFFFNDTATTEIYTLSLHDALPIYSSRLTFSHAAAASPHCCAASS